MRARCFQLFDDGERPVEVAKELESATWELAAKLIKTSPLAIREAKRAIRAIYEGWRTDKESTPDYVAPITEET